MWSLITSDYWWVCAIAVRPIQLLYLMEKAVLQIKSDHVLIMGDFNFPEISDAEETVSASANDPSSLFFNKTQELCLIQHVTEVTRVRQHQAPSTLDYVFTDEENLIDSIAYEPPLAKSCIWMWLYLDGTCCLLYKM